MVHRFSHLVSVIVRPSLSLSLTSNASAGTYTPQKRPGEPFSAQRLSRTELTPANRFKTAWVSYEEHIPQVELFGQPDIIAVDLADAASQIIAREAKRSEATFM